MKILLLTTLYSLPGEKILNNTNVCGSFAKEWVKAGHEVRVVYQYTIYNRIFHWLARFFKKQIADKLYGAVTVDRITTISKYIVDGVQILRIPIFKKAPRMLYSEKAIEDNYQKIILENKADGFFPDIIIGHFFYPNIQLVSMLKKEYPNCKTCIVVHYQGINISKTKKYLDKNHPDAISAIDIWGYRSIPIQKYFEKTYGKMEKAFYCFSGVPSSFFNATNHKSFDEIHDFVFVGALIKRKHPMAVIKALYLSDLKDFNLKYIGEGEQKKQIFEYAKQYNMLDSIQLCGHVARDVVSDYLNKAQIFIMISSKETFGLVYLEAMSKGCIVVASKGEGMEGIIKDGFNGFLCQAGNVNELISIINKIISLPKDTINEISLNAFNTAKSLTDKKVAENYINSVINI